MLRRRHFVALTLVALLSGAGCGHATRDAGTHAAAVAASPASATRLVRLEVGGMTCGDCVQKIDRQLRAVPGVRAAEVSLESRSATVTCEMSVADSSLIAAVRRAGPEYLGLIVQ